MSSLDLCDAYDWDTKDFFIPLEKCIIDTFIPAILGRSVSGTFTFHSRFGGIGIVNSWKCLEYQTSIRITKELVGLIYRQLAACDIWGQETTLKKLDKIKIKGRVNSLRLTMFKGALDLRCRAHAKLFLPYIVGQGRAGAAPPYR